VEGTNRYENQANGIFYVKEIIKAGLQTGGGYADYYYHKPNATENIAKRSYSLYFAPFNWVVGTGYYLEDVQKSCGYGSGDRGGCPLMGWGRK
jgi:methyl-accepting chemotaxis protein